MLYIDIALPAGKGALLASCMQPSFIQIGNPRSSSPPLPRPHLPTAAGINGYDVKGTPVRKRPTAAGRLPTNGPPVLRVSGAGAPTPAGLVSWLAECA